MSFVCVRIHGYIRTSMLKWYYCLIALFAWEYVIKLCINGRPRSSVENTCNCKVSLVDILCLLSNVKGWSCTGSDSTWYDRDESLASIDSFRVLHCSQSSWHYTAPDPDSTSFRGSVDTGKAFESGTQRQLVSFEEYFLRKTPNGISDITPSVVVIVVHRKVSGSYISRTVFPRITKFYTDIHADPVYSHTGRIWHH